MGKWTAPSDLDYDDVPQAAGTRCATPGCTNAVALPEWDTYCSECLQKAQERAETHERWLAAQEQKARRA